MFGIAVAGIAAALIYLAYSPPLSPAERDLVGKCAFPIGPNPLPNAVRQVFEFWADRQFVMHDLPVGNVGSSSRMSGRWRVVDGFLELGAEGSYPRSTLDRIQDPFGRSGPTPPKMDQRFRVLGRDGDTLRLEDEYGTVARLERFPD